MSAADEFTRLVQIMHRLRRECPWDREQDHASLRAYLLEETYEVLHALDTGDHEELRDELGDLLLQVVFHAEVAAEAGRFDIEDVLRGINEKLIRRHPHVFADADASDSEAVLRRWARIKADEENKSSVLEGVPASLPALLKAQRVLAKMRQSGLDPWQLQDPALEVRKCLERLLSCSAQQDREPVERVAGALCLAVAVLAARAHVNAEDALRETIGRMADAFRREEAAARATGRSLADLSDDEIAQVAARIVSDCEG